MPPLKCGIGYYTNRLLDELCSLEEVTLITTRGLESHSKVKEAQYVSDWRLLNLPKIVKEIRRAKPDIVHIQYPAKGYKRQLGINFLPLFLKIRRFKVPIVITLHEYYGSGILGKTRNLITAWLADKLLVSNPYDLQALPARLRAKTTIVPIGSNIPLAKRDEGYYRSLLKSLGADNEDEPVVFLGFPYENKGLESLIDAARNSDFSVLFLCEFDETNPYQKNLLERIRSLKKSGSKLYIAGFLSDTEVSQVMQESKIFVLPQKYPLTAKSGTAIAAALHGLIVISKAADDASLNMPFVNLVNSLLLDEMNDKNLADNLRTLKADRTMRQKLSSNAKELSDYFSWKNIANKHKKLYEDLS